MKVFLVHAIIIFLLMAPHHQLGDVSDRTVSKDEPLKSLADCEENTLCGDLALCMSEESTYKCECIPGTEKIDADNSKSQCKDIDECNKGYCQSGLCHNQVATFLCMCPKGFKFKYGEKKCERVEPDPCEADPCGEHGKCEMVECLENNGSCIFKMDSYTCKCDDEYHNKDSDITKPCVANTKCEQSLDCGSHSNCVDSNDSYKCECEDGYTKKSSDSGECIMDYCAESSCGEERVCINGDNYSYCCSTSETVIGRDAESCTIEYFCDQTCGSNSTCQLVDNTTSCNCNNGYQENDNGNCVKIDKPCGNNTDNCTKITEICKHISMDEGKHCICSPGYYLSNRNEDRGVCRKNPCHDKHVCGANSKCVDNNGSFECDCLDDYYLDIGGKSCSENPCEDIDVCGGDLTCKVVNGSAVCTCGEGYQKNESDKCIKFEKSCDDDDTCAENELCENISGKDEKYCICPTGHYKNASNECLKESCNVNQYLCVGDQVCVKDPGSKNYECRCVEDSQFIDGKCREPSECDEFPEVCTNKKSCIKSDKGIYSCACVSEKYDNDLCLDQNIANKKKKIINGVIGGVVGSLAIAGVGIGGFFLYKKRGFKKIFSGYS